MRAFLVAAAALLCGIAAGETRDFGAGVSNCVPLTELLAVDASTPVRQNFSLGGGATSITSATLLLDFWQNPLATGTLFTVSYTLAIGGATPTQSAVTPSSVYTVTGLSKAMFNGIKCVAQRAEVPVNILAYSLNLVASLTWSLACTSCYHARACQENFAPEEPAQINDISDSWSAATDMNGTVVRLSAVLRLEGEFVDLPSSSSSAAAAELAFSSSESSAMQADSFESSSDSASETSEEVDENSWCIGNATIADSENGCSLPESSPVNAPTRVRQDFTLSRSQKWGAGASASVQVCWWQLPSAEMPSLTFGLAADGSPIFSNSTLRFKETLKYLYTYNTDYVAACGWGVFEATQTHIFKQGMTITLDWKLDNPNAFHHRVCSTFEYPPAKQQEPDGSWIQIPDDARIATQLCFEPFPSASSASSVTIVITGEIVEGEEISLENEIAIVLGIDSGDVSVVIIGPGIVEVTITNADAEEKALKLTEIINLGLCN